MEMLGSLVTLSFAWWTPSPFKTTSTEAVLADLELEVMLKTALVYSLLTYVTVTVLIIIIIIIKVTR